MRTPFSLGLVFAFALIAVACGSEGDDGDDGASGGSTGGNSAGSMNGGTGGSSGTSAGQSGNGSSTGGAGTGGAASGGSAGSGVSAGDGAGGSAGGSGASGGAGGSANNGGSTAGSGDGGTNAGGASGSSSAGDGGTSAGGGGGLDGAVPSEGCNLATPSTVDGPQTFDLDGTEREFIIRLPEGYDGKSPNRIIFAFHGAQGSAEQVDNGDPANADSEPTGPFYGIKDHADARTIFVAGQADGSWGSGDIAYVEALVAKFKAELCIDESRILATGFSMGGIMTVRVACNLAAVFRAVAPMSCSLSAANCSDDGDPVAYWSSHGEEDMTVTMPNGEAARDEFVDRNGCDASATPMPIGDNGCVAYAGCDDGYPVNWCPFTGVHEPPSFAGTEIWAFLSQF
jgi:poly(3-hydroxybutyrate) depolymerase